jgi:two-component system, OmpR family, sensor histidine kinase TctE
MLSRWRLSRAGVRGHWWRDAFRNLVVTRDTDPDRPGQHADRNRRRTSTLRPSTESKTLFGEILDFMLAPLLLLWPLSIAITFVVARSLADAPFDRVLEDRLNLLATEVKTSRGTIQLGLSRKETQILTSDEEDRVYFQVIAPDGRLIAGEPNLPAPPLYDFPTLGQAKMRNDLFLSEEVRISYLYVTPRGGEKDGTGTLVQVAETLDKRSRLANEIIKGVILPQFIILPISVILVWIALRHALKPLKILRDRVQSRGPNDMSPIDPRVAPEEIMPLIDTFNEVLVRLARNARLQRRFIADAAHQIKTPLAGIRTQAELALREKDPQELELVLRQLVRGSDRAARLVSQLLSLARTEHQRESASFEEVNLVLLTRTVTADWFQAAREHAIDLGVETLTQKSVVLGNPILLTELLGNLIDNALRYSGARSMVTIRLRSVPDAEILEVEDNGVGIPSAAQELVFERFYRAEDAKSDGSGLGLAIVREIAEQHGASVQVKSVCAAERIGMVASEASGTCFTVRFSRPVITPSS